MSGATRSSVEVAIRVRPVRPEIDETKEAWDLTTTTAREAASPDTFFTFDHIYGARENTQQLYERSVRDAIVSRVAQGYNGTVFAYGQTGSGKTFTMFGGGTGAVRRGGGAGARQPSTSPGLIEMAIRDLFRMLDLELESGGAAGSSSSSGPLSAVVAAGRVKGFEVFVSEMEIYNEQLRDLLLPPSGGPPAKPLSIRENEHGVHVHNATRLRVASAAECLAVVYKHAESRVSAATAMNEHSSRSHCIIQIHVEKTVYADISDDDDDDDLTEADNDTGAEDDTNTDDAGSAASLRRCGGGKRAGPSNKKKLVSLLNLVDLAGSERVAKTGAVGLRMVEGGHINKSLTALTTVINRFAEVSNNGNKNTGNGFVPYRDSRLTHLLKTSIGGNSFTCIFCCVSPAVENADESRSTLQFASRAKRIRNRVSLNEVVNPRTRVRELEVELRRVRRQLVAQTIYLWSKQLTIKNLRERMDGGDGGGGGGPDHKQQHYGSASSAARRRAGPDAQRQIILEQLQAQNEALEEELGKLRAQLLQRPSVAPPSATSSSLAQAPAELAQLRADVADLESMLSGMESEKVLAERQLTEARRRCTALEGDAGRLGREARGLRDQLKEAEAIMEDLDGERDAAAAEADLLRGQLQRTQGKLLDRHRGGDASLQELTRLHIDHQELHVRHAQALEAAQRQLRERQAELARAVQAGEDLEDEKAEAEDRSRQLGAYLSRFLAVASLASKGRVGGDGDEGWQTQGPLPERDLAAALQTLTRAVSSSRAGGGGGGGDSGPGQDTAGRRLESNDHHQQRQNNQQAEAEAAALRVQVRELERQLIQRDAQRDVLVDTKLKRMQDLVLRLHAMNGALALEMRQCYADNEELFHLAQKHPKLAGSLSKAGLFPRSLSGALARARFAEPAEKPFGHN